MLDALAGVAGFAVPDVVAGFLDDVFALGVSDRKSGFDLDFDDEASACEREDPVALGRAVVAVLPSVELGVVMPGVPADGVVVPGVVAEGAGTAGVGCAVVATRVAPADEGSSAPQPIIPPTAAHAASAASGRRAT